MAIKLSRVIMWLIIAIFILISIIYAVNRLFQPEEKPYEAEIIPEEIVVPEQSPEPKDYIKWVDFKVPYKVLEKTLELDIKSQEEEVRLDWVDMIAYLAAKYGGEFSRYNEKDLKLLIEKLEKGEEIEEIAKDYKHFKYFREAYNAVLGEFVGYYKVEEYSDNDASEKEWKDKYGLKVFSPIAKGYGFNHYDDFGNSRSYGYKRKHMGHDLMGGVGTPVIAMESGIVEVQGWNQYGGWRIGIRSFDKKRYYYYAHLRKDHPYNKSVKEGDTVKAGDVIGYLGMTGYSSKENVNNIDTPHLHVGLQLIFDESQKEGVNQIWIDLYNIVKLLQKNRVSVYKDEESKDYYRKYDFYEPLLDKYAE